MIDDAQALFKKCQEMSCSIASVKGGRELSRLAAINEEIIRQGFIIMGPRCLRPEDRDTKSVISIDHGDEVC